MNYILFAQKSVEDIYNTEEYNRMDLCNMLYKSVQKVNELVNENQGLIENIKELKILLDEKIG